jgi:hypothetical protein
MNQNSFTQNVELISIFNKIYPELKFEQMDETLAKEIVENVLGMNINDFLTNNTKNINNEIQKTFDLANEHIPEMLFPTKLITLNGKIKDIPIKILIDTGANSNCIYKKKIIQAGLENIIDETAKSVVAGIQSNKETFGKIWYTDIELEIITPEKNKSYAMLGINLIVIDDENKETPFDLILGLNFMKSYKMNIDFLTNTITLNGNIKLKFE